jgi:FlaA1/EpsC-like NDP-sugar epimerase
MEKNVEDAVTNNILGTWNLTQNSIEHNIERFVLISTDKSVDPVSVMGMTKRIAELIVHQGASQIGRPFVSVRFGNVLDSRGSVIPLFRQQIASGGPVTVTHPEVKRIS